MNLPQTLLDKSWYWVAWAVWGVLFLRGIHRAPWHWLKESGRINFWLGAIVSLCLLWSLRAGVQPGLTLHFIGAAVLTLCAGPHLAFIGLSLVAAAVTFNNSEAWLGFAVNALLTAGPGIATVWSVSRWSARRLPAQLFVYLFVNAFFGGALSVLSVGLCITLVLAMAHSYSIDYMLHEYAGYVLLLSFAEAWLSGMIMTLLVVYRPEWVATFDDSRYLAGK